MRGNPHLPFAGARPRRAMTGVDTYIVAETIDRTDGGSRAAADIILALLAAGTGLVVLSRDRFEVPGTAAGIDLPRPRWLVPPIARHPRRVGRPVDAVVELVTGLVAAARLPFDRLRLAHALRVAPAHVVIHNGFPAPGSLPFETVDPTGQALHVLVVHSSIHQVASFAANRPGLTVEGLRDTMAGCDGLVFVSPQIRDEWLGPMVEPPPVVRVVAPCCRDEEIRRLSTEPIDRVRTRLGLPSDAFVIVSVGKVHPMKGQDLVIERFRDMAAHTPNARLVLVGSITAEAADMVRRVEELGLTDLVTFTGPVRTSLDYIYAADVLVHASRAEGFGLVVAEAMALGTPVLASDAGGIQSLVTDDVTGLAFPVGDGDGMVRRFADLVADPLETAARVERAQRHYRESFSRPAMIAAYRELLAALPVTPGRTRQHPSQVPPPPSGPPQSAPLT